MVSVKFPSSGRGCKKMLCHSQHYSALCVQKQLKRYLREKKDEKIVSVHPKMKNKKNPCRKIPDWLHKK